MSLFINNKKLSRVYINNKNWAKAYYNGKLIFSNGGISFGILHYIDKTTGKTLKQTINLLSDFELLFDLEHNASNSRDINFSFGTINSFNITKWTFNTNRASMTLYKSNIIGTGFLANLPYLNSNIKIPSWITTISDYFLAMSPNLIAKGHISQFNGNITFGKSLKNIGNYFLYGANRFNKPINTNNVETIGNNFLQAITNYGDTPSFNSTVTLPNVKTINANFMNRQNIFNNLISLDKIVSIGNNFMNSNNVFNKIITLPNTLTSIGENFMQDCFRFNHNIVIPPNCSVGNRFLCSQNRNALDESGMLFSSTLTLSEGCTVYGAFLSFMRASAQPTIVVNCDVNDIDNSDYTLLYNNNGTTHVSGVNAQAFIDKFKNGTYNYGKRNLVLVTQ